MQDAWRAYLEVALGLTEASRKQAKKVAKELFGKGGATAAQLQNAATELVATGRANRETLTRLVRYEVDRALGAMGLATAEEVSELAIRVEQLERRLREAEQAAPPAPVAQTPAPQPPPAKKAVAKKAVAQKAPAQNTTAKQTAAKTTAKKTVAKKTA